MKTLQAWCKNPKNFLFITGSPGCGKTYIASAMLAWMYGNVGSFRIWNDQHLLERLRNFISSDMRGDFGKEIEYLIDDEFIILDDMGSSQLTDWQVDVWFKVINTRYENALPTLITTNLTSKEIYENLGPRTHSRIFAKENKIIDMHEYKDLRQSENIK